MSLVFGRFRLLMPLLLNCYFAGHGSLPDVLKAGVFSEFASLKTVNGLPGSRPKKQTGPLADSKRAIETHNATKLNDAWRRWLKSGQRNPPVAIRRHRARQGSKKIIGIVGTIRRSATLICFPQCKNLGWQTHPPGQPPGRSSDTSGLGTITRAGAVSMGAPHLSIVRMHLDLT